MLKDKTNAICRPRSDLFKIYLMSALSAINSQIFATRCYASAAYVVMWCLSVRLSICQSRSYILSKRINISSKVFTIGQPHHSSFFPYQTAWQYFDPLPLTGTSNAGGLGRNRDSEPISGLTAC